MLMKNDQHDPSPRHAGLPDRHFLDLALELAATGAKVHPLRFNTKVPTTATGFTNGLHDATDDPATIERMWTLDGVVQHYNIGRAAGHGVLALDVDVSVDKDGAKKPGQQSLQALIDMGLDVDTRIVRSARGGLHILYAEPDSAGFMNSNRHLKKNFPGLDIKTDGGYLVAPGSIIDGKPYTVVKDVPIAPLPDVLRSRLVRRGEDAPEREKPGVGSEHLDHPIDIQRATEYLRGVAKTGIPSEGHNSDDFTYSVVAKLRDFGVTEYTACDLMAQHFTPHTAFDDEWVDVKVANAYRHAQNAPGVKSFLMTFDDLGDPKPVSEATAIFAASEASQAERGKADDVYPLLTIDEITTRPPPRMLVERHIPEKSVGFLYSEPGAGKTFIALDLTLAASHGLEDWHGDKINRPDGVLDSPVIYIAAEGSYGFRNRILAWKQSRQIPANLSKPFFMIEQTIDFMQPEDMQKLLRTARAAAQRIGRAPALFVVDTVSRAIPGADENLQKDMTTFVRSCDALRDAFGCAVLGVHHAGKSGDMRGSTVLRGAGDFVFRLAREEGATIGRLHCEKQKDGPSGWEGAWRFDPIGLDDGQGSLVVAREDATIGPACELTPDRAARVLAAMAAAWDAGEPWSKAPQSGERRAVRRMVSDFGFGAEPAEKMLDLWERSGLIAVGLRDAKRRRSGFKVLAAPGQTIQSDGIFG